MFATGSLILLYFWTFFSGTSSSAGLLISSSAVIVSALAFLAAVVFYLWIPKTRTYLATGVVYAAIAATAGTLIATSQGIDSPFIAFWILVAVFASILGIYGSIVMFGAGSYFLVTEILQRNIDQSTVIVTILAGWLPLVISYVIWHARRSSTATRDDAYHELASELSNVANKSDAVINAIADGVIAIDSNGVVQLINPAAQNITGWGKQDANDLSYKSILQLIDNKDQELSEANDPILQTLSTNKETATSALSLKTHSGKKLLVSLIISPVGQLGAGAIIVFRDITKEKQDEREQAEFISTASHEMRTPVASIEGYLGLALNPATAQIDDKARDFIHKAHESAEHLGRLFQDLLDVSKADDGRISNNPKAVDIVAYTSEIIEGLRPQAEAKELRLTYKPTLGDGEEGDRHLSPIFYANIDNDHLREVIANLTENAIKYTIKGDVIIDVTGDDEHIIISFADSGIGIPAEDIPHLFQKFYRVDNTDTREIGGTGLGLYLCRRLAEIMGGRIWVESEYKKGSTFFLELPRIDHVEATRMIEAAAQTNEIIPDPPATAPATPPIAPPIQPQPEPLMSLADMTDQLTAAMPPVAPVAPSVPATPPQTPIAPIHENTPLSQVEAHPEQYTRPASRPISIPVREHDK